METKYTPPECSICLDPFTNPKVLTCGHSFCLDCLRDHVGKKRKQFKCPTCRQDIIVPTGGMDQLITNYALFATENTPKGCEDELNETLDTKTTLTEEKEIDPDSDVLKFHISCLSYPMTSVHPNCIYCRANDGALWMMSLQRGYDQKVKIRIHLLESPKWLATWRYSKYQLLLLNKQSRKNKILKVKIGVPHRCLIWQTGLFWYSIRNKSNGYVNERGLIRVKANIKIEGFQPLFVLCLIVLLLFIGRIVYEKYQDGMCSFLGCDQ